MFDEDLLAGLQLAPPKESAPPPARLQLRLPWYRSLPFSSIEGISAAIDGEPVASEALAVVVNGEPCTLTQVAGMHEVVWFVLDTVDVEISGSHDWTPGPHQFGVTLQLRIPYGVKGFRELNFRQVARCSRELTLPGGGE